MQVLAMPRVVPQSTVFGTARPTQEPVRMPSRYPPVAAPAQRAPRPCVMPVETVDPSLPRDIASRFGRRVRGLRHARSMTQVEVSVHFGIDRTFISDVERGRKSVCLPTMEVFALGFGLSLSELLQGL